MPILRITPMTRKKKSKTTMSMILKIPKISRLFFRKSEPFLRPPQSPKSAFFRSNPTVKLQSSNYYTQFEIMQFVEVLHSTCSNVHCISSERLICELNHESSLQSFE